LACNRYIHALGLLEVQLGKVSGFRDVGDRFLAKTLTHIGIYLGTKFVPALAPTGFVQGYDLFVLWNMHKCKSALLTCTYELHMKLPLPGRITCEKKSLSWVSRWQNVKFGAKTGSVCNVNTRPVQLPPPPENLSRAYKKFFHASSFIYHLAIYSIMLWNQKKESTKFRFQVKDAASFFTQKLSQ
jgi:hypothetical protein